jgi:5'-3' exonuclease
MRTHHWTVPIFFTLNAIFSYVTKFNPDRVIAAWDEKTEYHVNERKQQYSEYKGNRSSDLSPHQNNTHIKQLLQYLGISSIFPKQYEADDIISYICRFTPGQKTIISVDKDFLQLIAANITLYDPIKKEEYNLINFKEKTGYSDTETWLRVKCILGDKSDNVTGIPRFGKSKLVKYLNNELTLSDEEYKIVQRNHKLFNLSDLSAEHDECLFYKEQLDTTQTADWNSFLQECRKRELNSIINKKESWYSLFFLKDKLKSIFG